MHRVPVDEHVKHNSVDTKYGFCNPMVEKIPEKPIGYWYARVEKEN